MDKVHTITRRGGLIGALVGTAAIAVPAAATVTVSPSITELFAQWMAARTACDSGSDVADEAQRHYEVYAQLQGRIVEMTPRSAREAAMQFVVETDCGDSDYHDAFYVRFFNLAMGS